MCVRVRVRVCVCVCVCVRACVCVRCTTSLFLFPQGMLPKEILHALTERCLVSLVNSAGVDVTACMEHPHWAAALQFACGLGPRKAAYIVRVRLIFVCPQYVCLTTAIKFGSVVGRYKR